MTSTYQESYNNLFRLKRLLRGRLFNDLNKSHDDEFNSDEKVNNVSIVGP